MPRIVITLDSKFDKKTFERLLGEASMEVGMKGMVEDIKETIPHITLLVGVLRGQPKGKVAIEIKDRTEQ